MKGQIWQRLRQRPRLSRKDIALTLIPAVAWGAQIHLRPYLFSQVCFDEPGQCQPETVNFLDALSLNHQSRVADHYSFKTQDLSGYLAFGVPLVWHTGMAAMGRLTPAGALATFGVDAVIIAQSIFWNGWIKETTHAISQRPRPFVYTDPVRLGKDPAHYTSFFSGHTSFSAVSNTALVFTLAGRGAPPWLVAAAATLGSLLIFLTGLFRVLAGRHFATDVLTAAVMGILTAAVIAWLHRDRRTP